jgi:hypothetical protein
MIIGLAGRAGSGKDTVATIVQELYPDLSWQIKGFADKLRQVASLLTGIPAEEMKKQEVKERILWAEWDYTKEVSQPWESRKTVNAGMSVRAMLQKLGTDAIRDGLHENAWVNALMVDYKVDDNILMFNPRYGPPYPKNLGTGKYPNWLIPDTRFPNELEAITSRGGICIRVVRPNNPYPKSDHISETALDGVELLTIINDGNLDQLKLRVQEVFDPIVHRIRSGGIG